MLIYGGNRLTKVETHVVDGFENGGKCCTINLALPFLQPPSSVEGTSGWNACKKYGYIKQANENYVYRKKREMS